MLLENAVERVDLDSHIARTNHQKTDESVTAGFRIVSDHESRQELRDWQLPVVAQIAQE